VTRPEHPALVAVDLGRIPYAEALELQRSLVAARRAGRGEDWLLLCEHDEVVTHGRTSQVGRDPAAELALASAAGVPVVEVERGGAATYHGPGQLVGYPIVRLAPDERDLHRFLRHLEEALIGALGEAGLEAGRNEGWTGVWAEEKKLASIGIACRGWVTYHGFALNLSTDLSRFALFRPCDLEASVMASLESLGVTAEREALIASVHTRLAELLGREPRVGRRAELP
jgi:lipoate-protein ligase B